MHLAMVHMYADLAKIHLGKESMHLVMVSMHLAW
jgi:hypothetical protein